MMAWQSFVFLFLLPATDLALRLIGLSSFLVACLDFGALFVLAYVLPRRIGLDRKPLITPELWRGLAACVLVGLVWYLVRVSAYNFGAYGENIYDLHYIASLVRATEWPAADLWNPGAKVDHYYYFGFYIVAFYTRLLGLDIGQGYVLMLLLIPVLVFANFWTVMRGHFVLRAAAALTASFPATGFSAVIFSNAVDVAGHLRGMAHVRLVEWTNLAPADGWLADLIRGYAYPVEGLAHILGSLGDLHPPVFTFLLLALVLTVLLGNANEAGDETLPVYSRLICGSAIPLSFVINPWTLPCFAVLGLYAASRPLSLRSAAWVALGAAAMLSLSSPMLMNLELQTGSVGLRWLAGDQRSPFTLLFTVWGPLLLVTTLLMLAGAVRTRWVLLLWFVAMVVGLEVLLLDDPYGERYERFNGVLKIGSFALAGWTAVVLRDASRSPRRWIQVAATVPLLCLSLAQLWDSVLSSVRKPLTERNWALHPGGMLENAEHRQLFSALSLRCPGVTLEHQTAQAYSQVPLVSTLLGWPTLSGWTSHLNQIGAWGTIAQARFEHAQQWFDNPQTELLLAYGVRYVLIDSGLGWDEQALQRHSATLNPHFQFVRLSARDSGNQKIVGYFAWNGRCTGDPAAS
ncbi:MAG: DUF2298 domain-containing protein [Pseudomonadota bacterium]|nr:DUF2298 domain-containing protein [Pseudomonadota bacterium]